MFYYTEKTEHAVFVVRINYANTKRRLKRDFIDCFTM